ncbi:TRM11 family methyltransferase [Deminuibacter soli]|uniref:Methyltransferase domain-containing protein n=1 Tax=Deminuibacter soli TaxID=2291815 RepID=A0A3E1NQH2_9BACT|nr:class I SAM-dependent methyltransferase [Deminuibacter soli]RFM30048.1 methyltransferase domain-containing protein [Deminuibacter soli]
MIEDKLILDACCGARKMWFDKNNPNAIYGDIRSETHELIDGRTLEIRPDVVLDFTQLPFPDETFRLVAFDPPHIHDLGKSSIMAKTYGILSYHWRDDIREGLKECLRVLKPYGVLVFKWSESSVKLSDVMPLLPQEPVFGHTSGKHGRTIWMTFLKK